jgi:hypothetical protein
MDEQEHRFLNKIKEIANYDESKGIKKIEIFEAWE